MRCSVVMMLVVVLQAGLVGADERKGEARALFNGKDLSGWEGDGRFWSVQDGAITGRTTKENPSKGNTFLVWKGGALKDFELRVKFRIEGGNSGIQYRSREKGKFLIQGYQADLDAANAFTGICFEEGGERGIMAKVGEKVKWNGERKKEVVGSVGDAKEIKVGIRAGDWNEYVIICRGKRMIQAINGKVTVEVVDEDEGRGARDGVIGLQLGAGGPMVVQFKDVTVRVIGGE